MSKKTGKIPKKVAGMKIPKALRKSGAKLLEQANTPKGREVIASGLAMVAAVAASRAKARHDAAPPSTGTPTPAECGEGTSSARATVDPGEIVDALSAAAGAFVNGLMGRKG